MFRPRNPPPSAVKPRATAPKAAAPPARRNAKVPLSSRALSGRRGPTTFAEEAAQLRKQFKHVPTVCEERPFVRERAPRIGSELVAARLGIPLEDFRRLCVPRDRHQYGYDWLSVCKHLAQRLDRGETLPITREDLC